MYKAQREYNYPRQNLHYWDGHELCRMQVLSCEVSNRNFKEWTTVVKLSFLTLHKSCDVAVFWCGGEVVVPKEPPEMQIIKKTAKVCTMMRAEPERCDYWLKSVLRALHLNGKYSNPSFCLYLFSLIFVPEISSMFYNYMFMHRHVID